MRKTTAALAALAVTAGVGIGALVGAPLVGSAAPAAGIDASIDSGLAAAVDPVPDATLTAGRRHPRIRAAIRRHAVEVSAKAIGIEPKELRDGLHAGSSIADVATAKGVDVQKVVDALVAAGSARVDQAVSNGRLTEARGADLKAKLPALADRAVHAHRQKR
jgi:hypothetical protein